MFKKIFAICFIVFSFFIQPCIAQEIKIIHFSDVHIDTKRPDGDVRKYASSLKMFQKAIIKANAYNPDLVVFSGDMINSPIASEFDIFLKNARNLNSPFYPVVGNHDVGVNGGLSKKCIISQINKNCEWMNIKNTSYSVTKGNFIFIFMDGTIDNRITSKGYFSKQTLDFLEKTLITNANKKAIIVQHFPLIEPLRSQSHEIENKEEYLNILNKHNNVILVLSGHYHASSSAVHNGVLHISTPSLIEYPHAFRVITINDENSDIRINSELITDTEQNSRENTITPYTILKMGLSNDNNFEVILKK